ncbi:TlpA family protein disulfide reductase [Flavilitoribacter nigricans]|uniref:Alkyl hydroperoxide reductase n=1 Tax=Flavilitoribacter nigricans (strain ATCC 23147 / DSM 23189 / NBRC 102662 / NCIMB 1420 / SS-2) TaxID=1122177 RepID=A0A2D0N2V3_FLAN2|nr:TlpA disulfide reductase family protein [Flavilitoribacter nigricans]PHN02872.1 alkyl hydroperoxide reductase [Flavilitoribacter nigricans DSM 23189 = NBRC 102662]
MLVKYRLVFAFILFSLSSCFVIENTFTGLPPGKWRAVLKLEPKQITPNPKGQPLPEKLNLKFEEVTAGELPFNFEVIYENETDFYIEIRNGEERIRLDDIVMGRDPRTAKDTILIDIPIFDSYFKGIYEENLIEGTWVVRNREEYIIPFVARFGQDHRFTTLRKDPVMDLSGKWKTFFEVDTDNPLPAIGEFQQDGNHLLGTFRTETGDYRFLEGTVQADKLYLSCFDGSHAFLFEGKIQPDSTIIGIFRSGKHYKTIWEAQLDPTFTLADPDSLTSMKEGEQSISFSFPDAEGNIISLSDKRFENKPKIIQLMGTWCPNCWDETKFLIDYIQEYSPEGIEFLALAFEKYRDKDRALRAIDTYQKRMNLPYPILWAGFHEKAEALEALPMLRNIDAFPTLIFLDRNNQVVKIHSGFNGPATSKYDEFVSDFNKTVQSLAIAQ